MRLQHIVSRVAFAAGLHARRAAWAWTANGLARSSIIPESRRYIVLRALGVRVKKSYITSSVFFGSSHIAIGRDSFIGRDVFLDSFAPISIGDRVYIGPRTLVLTSTHNLGDGNRRALETIGKEVHIGDGTWIGAGSVLIPGVSVGEGCVIGAGSVVTRDCEPNVLYVGNPAKAVRHL